MGILRFIFSLVFGGVMSWLRSWREYLRGKEEGAAEVIQLSTVRAAQAAAEAKEIRNEIEALPADELKRRASRWVRGANNDKPAKD